MRKPPRYFNLQRPKIRLSWNKHNVYNLARMVGRDRSTADRMTFFQMKWDAKSRTRGYHGEHIAEKKWKRMFSHRLMSAVDLPPQYLAEHDGSEQAAGRGSGISTNDVSAEKYSNLRKLGTRSRTTHGLQRPSMKRGDPERMLSKHHKDMTPYMQMAYAPLERRLDMAVFRALFASSVRQARQFIIHGAVEVNGKKMVHPSYQLNPGDMFQVEVEKVLYGTGKQHEPRGEEKIPKNPVVAQRRRLRRLTEKDSKDVKEAGQEKPWQKFWADVKGLEGHPKFKDLKELTQEPHIILSKIEQIRSRTASDGKLDFAGKEILKDVMSRTRRLLGNLPEDTKFEEMVADFRLLLANRDALIKELIEEAEKNPAPEPEAGSETAPPPAENAENADAAADATPSQERRIQKAATGLTKAQAERLRATLENEQFKLSNDAMRNLAQFIKEDEENPYDPSKPYKTPWEPRPFMSAFAFIPRYLEVNPNVCAAVYLRHPVARKGMAEVPTPFSYLTNQLAHNWYLQRGPRMRN
ncbi:hypothetical protein NLU13_4887 [Sarocladium strictum]|uniref:RNA-binding S4 domain-containing protein n=1 Tax=Sarocladium strictum TaxID=5046 RepID=A0AA39GLG5_SARSR|nr:hypothetical protein NLU13_4887 [Sarocladium strictum]